MRKFLSVFTIAATVALGAAQTGLAAAAEFDVTAALAEQSIGSKDAPVTIQAFESLTCPHCAAFEKDTFPEIKKAYIDTGKVRLVFNDFPLDGRALLAHMVARCAGRDRYFGMINLLFATQRQWAHAETPESFLASLNAVARQGGMTDEEFAACTKNQALYDTMIKRIKEVDEKYKISSTPTFIIGDQRIVGSQPFADFKKVIDPMLPKP